jgi:MFS transporter, PHS family, inorganic phosphate transporter
VFSAFTLAAMSSEEENETYESFEDFQRLLRPLNRCNMRQPNGDDSGLFSSEPSRQGTSPSLLIPMISNFSTSYNVVNISMVLPILEQVHDGATSEDAAACASSLLAGMIVGQLFGGALGDSPLGRIGALRVVMSLQVIASIASAFLGVTKKEDIFIWLAACRFFLGIGCGGVYPLAAVLSAEQKVDDEVTTNTFSHSHLATESSGTRPHMSDSSRQEEKDDDSVHRVVLTFSTQGIGFVAVPIVSVILLHSTSNLNFVWRFILGLGALPGLLLIILQCHWSRRASQQCQLVPTEDTLQRLPESQQLDRGDGDFPSSGVESNQRDEGGTGLPVDSQHIQQDGVLVETTSGSWLTTLFHEPGLGRKILGTAGTWFLFDVVFYGNTIFQPIVVEAAFGGAKGEETVEHLRRAAIDSLILTCIALPGYAVAGIVMGKKSCCITQTPRFVMLQGFAAMAVLYAAIGVNWSYLRAYPAVLVFLYGLTFFFANYGPNTTTFILPSLIFEQEHRATWNGVSAAAGKLGALTGATFFEPAADALGDGSVMIICAAVAIIAFTLTFVAVPKRQPSSYDGDPSELPVAEGESV